MKPGCLPQTAAVKAARGTDRKDRAAPPEFDSPEGAILPPTNSMSLQALEVWEQLAPIAIAMKTLRAADCVQFGIFCSIVAMIHQAHRAGEPAPAAVYAEERRQAELFGLAGPRSRIAAGSKDTNAAANPFAKNGKPQRAAAKGK